MLARAAAVAPEIVAGGWESAPTGCRPAGPAPSPGDSHVPADEAAAAVAVWLHAAAAALGGSWALWEAVDLRRAARLIEEDEKVRAVVAAAIEESRPGAGADAPLASRTAGG